MGSARANAQQPTVNQCNPLKPDCMSDFTPMSELAYCTQFDKSKVAQKAAGDPEEDGKAAKSHSSRRLEDHDRPEDARHKSPQAECEYWDAPAMTRGRSPVPGTLFMPTRITSTKQTIGCQPDEGNDYTCGTKPWVHAPGSADENVKTIMVADVERFTVLVNQAFTADLPGHDVSGRASDSQGFVKGRPDLVDFYVQNEKAKGYIHHLEQDDKDELKHISTLHPIPPKPDFKGDFKNIFSLKGNGDVFEVHEMLRMADLRGSKLLDEVREDGSTMRTEGAVISIDITYTNAAKWDFLGAKEPHYTISAKFIPMQYYKIVYESMPTYDSKFRTMHNVHGLLFLFTVKGNIRIFTLSNLLIVLTTAMVSLAMANTLTDVIMSYCPCLNLKDHYNILKFQETMDFSDLDKRIAHIKAECKRKGEKYSPDQIKASACSQAINKFAATRSHIENDEMLGIICCFEQRLNRLDGMDASPEDDACAQIVEEFRKKYAPME